MGNAAPVDGRNSRNPDETITSQTLPAPFPGLSAHVAPLTEYRLFSFLVVDDDKDAADALADVFRLAGHDCVVAYDGRSSLDEARRFHIDVVILDINMPGLDGYETASCFLSAQVAQSPILIALTALSSREAKVQAMQIGFDAFVVKPANPHRLMDLVGKLVAERRPDAGWAGAAEFRNTGASV